MNITWPAGIQAQFQSTLDSLLSTQMLGRSCILYFPPIQTPCPQAHTNVGNIDNSYWSAGNPLPINAQQPLCTYCGGNGFIAVEPTGVITQVLYWPPARYDANFPPGERHPEGPLRTKGFTTDLQAVLNCTRMEAYYELGMSHYNFKLAGDIVTPGKLVPNRYFYAWWDRI